MDAPTLRRAVGPWWRISRSADISIGTIQTRRPSTEPRRLALGDACGWRRGARSGAGRLRRRASRITGQQQTLEHRARVYRPARTLSPNEAARPGHLGAESSLPGCADFEEILGRPAIRMDDTDARLHRCRSAGFDRHRCSNNSVPAFLDALPF